MFVIECFFFECIVQVVNVLVMILGAYYPAEFRVELNVSKQLATSMQNN